MAKFSERMAARELRRSGLAIGVIARQLGVSKASVSGWCSDLVLTRVQREAIEVKRIREGHRGRIIGAAMNKQKRLQNIALQQGIAKSLVDQLSSRDILMLGIALYWGEGTKSRGSSTAITNSDPAIILLSKKWFEMLGVLPEDFRPQVFISESHQGREELLKSYWSKLLGIPEGQFAKMVFLKGRPKKIYENHNSYYGVLALGIRRGTTLKYRILGLIEVCKQEAGVAQLVSSGRFISDRSRVRVSPPAQKVS